MNYRFHEVLDQLTVHLDFTITFSLNMHIFNKVIRMKYTGILWVSLALLLPQVGAAQETLPADIQNNRASEQPMWVADASQEFSYEGIPADDVSSTNSQSTPTNSNASEGTEGNEAGQSGDASKNEGEN